MTTDELREMCEGVTRKVAAELKPTLDFLKANGFGVTIFAFTFEPGAMAYLSTSNREDMIRSLKEWIAYQESGLTTEPHGDRGVG